MKAILLSIQPKWVAKILNGDKTIEVRKRFPKDYKGWVYIYCTKEDSLIKLQETYKDRYICEQEFKCDDFPKMYSGYEGKGKVVARFYCDKVDMPFLKDITKESCLTLKELIDYLEGKPCNAIYISQLEIFDKPKELSDFYKSNNDTKKCLQIIKNSKDNMKSAIGLTLLQKEYGLTKAPQSYMFIEVEE